MKNKCILVLEDDELLKKAITTKLERANMAPVSFTNGRDALQFLKTGSPLPEAIWLDFYLPDMNGDEFMAELRKDTNLERIPVVVVSNSASTNKVNKMLGLGVKKYILKADSSLDDIVSELERDILQSTNSKEILLVEDEPSLTSALTTKLTKENFIVTSATDGIEGLAKFDPERTSLILLDLVMPRMEGEKMLEKLQAMNIKLPPIIILTNKVIEGTLSGATRILQKSDTSLENVIEAIKEEIKEK